MNGMPGIKDAFSRILQREVPYSDQTSDLVVETLNRVADRLESIESRLDSLEQSQRIGF